MKLKEYKLEKVKYHFDRGSRKWRFSGKNYTLLQACPGGKETADKVASQMNGALKRNKAGELDNLARGKISNIIASVE